MEPPAKKRRQNDDDEEEYSGAGDAEDNETEPEPFGEEQQAKVDTKKHIHPCICDLDARRRAKIDAFLKRKSDQQIKYEKRVKEIEEELERLEEERLARERELREQQELFGDEYEVVGKKKKRKKRSARRASMVSLGVKQVINWKKQPKYKVKHTVSSNLRKEYTAYCGLNQCPESPPRPIDYLKEPNVPIRATHTFEIRTKTNVTFKQFLIDSEDKRPPFVTPYYV